MTEMSGVTTLNEKPWSISKYLNRGRNQLFVISECQKEDTKQKNNTKHTHKICHDVNIEAKTFLSDSDESFSEEAKENARIEKLCSAMVVVVIVLLICASIL